MKLYGVSWTALVCVIIMMKMSNSDLEVNVSYLDSEDRTRVMMIGFDNIHIMSFLDCVCTKRSKQCYVYLWERKNHKRSVYLVTADETNTSAANNLYLKLYNCRLETTYLIICQRMTGPPSTNGKPFIYINELNICELKCVGILWSTLQTVTVRNNETDILKHGIIPKICSSNSNTETTSTMAMAMVTKTTPILTSTTTRNISWPSEAKATEFTKTDTNGSLAGSSDVLASNTSIIVGVTVSFVLLIALVLGAFFLIRWRQKQVKETGSCMKSNVTGSLVETSHGTFESSYSEVENEKKRHKDVSKYQYSQINSAFVSENSTHEYSNVKADPQENINSDQNPQPTPIEKSASEIVQSNGGYSLASVSNKQILSNSQYSDPDNDTEKCKPHKARKNVNSQIPTDDTYSNFEKPRQEHNTFVVFQDSPSLNNQLAMNINDAESQNKQEAASLDTTAKTQTKDYAVLGDQKREFTNPYNCSFDPTSSSIQTIPTNNEPHQYYEKCENPSPDYCLASSLINNDKMSQLNSISNTKEGGLQIVTSEYDLARE